MKAIKLKKEFIKNKKLGEVGVIAISQDRNKPEYWYHIHNDEEIPEAGFDIAIHIRSNNGTKISTK